MQNPADDGFIWIPVSPRVKQRPRLGRKGRVFTPQQTVDYEKRLADEWAVACGPPSSAALLVDVLYGVDGQWIRVQPDPDPDRVFPRGHGDIDNYIKATLDGLNGAAWLDDKQVQMVTAAFMTKQMPTGGNDA